MRYNQHQTCQTALHSHVEHGTHKHTHLPKQCIRQILCQLLVIILRLNQLAYGVGLFVYVCLCICVCVCVRVRVRVCVFICKFKVSVFVHGHTPKLLIISHTHTHADNHTSGARSHLLVHDLSHSILIGVVMKLCLLQRI